LKRDEEFGCVIVFTSDAMEGSNSSSNDSSTSGVPNGFSTFLSEQEISKLREWILEGDNSLSDISFNLLYDSLTDGEKTNAFHLQCDNKGPTISVGLTDDGSILGGFASDSWESDGGFGSAPGSFLFSLRDRTGSGSFVMATLYQNTGHAMYGGPDCFRIRP